jgi:hypothetical protein
MSSDDINEMVGSVAEETARLLESLRRAQTPEDRGHDRSDDSGGIGSEDDAEEEVPVAQPGRAPGAEGSGPEAHHCSCGHSHELVGPVRMGESSTCTYCPICRGVVLARTLTPETLGRLAEVAMLAATVLREFATRQQEDTDAEQAPPPRRPATGEQVPVLDEDD